MPRTQLDDLIARFLEDALTPAERENLLAELKSSETSSDVFRQALEFNALMQATARGDTRFSQDVLAAVRSSDDAGAKKFSGDTIARLRKSSEKAGTIFAPAKSRFALLKWSVSAAALLFIAVCAIWYFNSAPDSDTFARATITTVSGPAEVSRDNTPNSARVGLELKPGDSLHTSLNASVGAHYTDGSTLTLGADSMLGLSARAGLPQNKELRLDAGTLSIQAAHQPADRPMVVTTPHAVATVVGTRFVLSVDRQKTTLGVTEGRVRFETLADHSSLIVGAGEHAATPVSQAPAPAIVPTRNPALWPFSQRSPWNMPVGDQARFAPISSPAYDASKGVRVLCREFSHPVFTARTSDPTHKVFVLQNAEPYAMLRVPDAMQPDGKHYVHCLIDPLSERFYEFSDLKRLPNGDLNAHEAYGNELNSDGFPGADGSARISGAAGIGGLIRSGELKNGIPHAVALTAPRNALGYAPSGQTFVWPANTGNLKLSDAPSNLHFGTLLAIPQNVDLRTLGVGSSGPAFEIAKALQDYGGYVVESFNDNKSALGIFVEPGAAEELPAELEAQLAKLVAPLQTIANNTPETPGGGGVLRRSPAPPMRKNDKSEF